MRGFNAVFGFACSRFRTATEPRELLFYKLLALVAFDFAERFLFGFLLEIVSIVSVEILHGAAVDLEDAVRDTIKKIAIVSDEKKYACVPPEIVFEPLNGVGVEVIGRLVEDKDVGFEDQLMCECDALSLAAGERTHLCMRIGDIEFR